MLNIYLWVLPFEFLLLSALELLLIIELNLLFCIWKNWISLILLLFLFHSLFLIVLKCLKHHYRGHILIQSVFIIWSRWRKPNSLSTHISGPCELFLHIIHHFVLKSFHMRVHHSFVEISSNLIVHHRIHFPRPFRFLSFFFFPLFLKGSIKDFLFFKSLFIHCVFRPINHVSNFILAIFLPICFQRYL